MFKKVSIVALCLAMMLSLMPMSAFAEVVDSSVAEDSLNKVQVLVYVYPRNNADNLDAKTQYQVNQHGTLPAEALVAPTPMEGCTFVGWNTNELGKGLTVDKDYTFKFDTDVYAVYNTNIIYHANGTNFVVDGAEKDSISCDVKLGEKATPLSVTAANGRALKGWATTTSGPVVYSSTSQIPVNGKIDLYAVWAGENECKVSFDTQVQTYSAVEDQFVTKGGKVERPADPDTSSALIFKGWYKDSEGKVAWDFENDVVTADTTIYAFWKEYPTFKPLTSIAAKLDTPASGKSVAAVTESLKIIATPSGKYSPDDELEIDWYRCKTKSSEAADWELVNDDAVFESGWYYAVDIYLYAYSEPYENNTSAGLNTATSPEWDKGDTYYYVDEDTTKGYVNGTATDTTFGDFILESYGDTTEVYLSKTFYVTDEPDPAPTPDKPVGPSTDDTTNLLFWITMGIIACGGVSAIQRKRRAEK